jgi:hypothetical protein
MSQLYPKNTTPRLDPRLFQRPTSEYRGAPFWSWNAKLTRERLFAQIEALKAMGLGGFHMHSRTGLAAEYLGPEFLAMVRACVEKAKADNMLAWLYDEDRWPSGFAGGLVTRDPQHRLKFLRFTSDKSKSTGKPMGCYAVTLQNGRLAAYRRLSDGATGAGTIWNAYLESQPESPWFNHQTYADTLRGATTEKFIEVTHERFRQTCGAEFGATVPAIFTDEPNMGWFRALKRADATDDATLPWTTDFADTYRATYGEDILDFLPEIFWELPAGRVSRARYRYHNHRTDRFADAFARTIGEWCGRHNLMLTGHMLCEENLLMQTGCVGEVMRSLAHFQLPGIDMLCDNIELSTAKQAQSVARQFGRPGVMSELYGVTNWDFDFTGHKRQGDWQAALGVTVRVPHLAWVSMAGESKRDYPAPIDEHSPWYREYPLVEDHFARLNTVLTRGQPVCRVAVVHPIESFWVVAGPEAETRRDREELETNFDNLNHWLLHGLVDFDYISEALWPTQQLNYECIIVPGLKTIRPTTLDRLEKFAGTVIFAGEVPALVDAEPSDRPAKLAARCRQVPFSRVRLLEALEPYREVGADAAGLLYQLRQDGDCRYLFLCNTSRDKAALGARVTVRGQWRVTELDTLTGAERPVAAIVGADTTFTNDFHGAGSLLVRLDIPAIKVTAEPAAQWKEISQIAGPVPVTLDEPNVLVLDQAEFRLDDGVWEPVEEVLRLDNVLRRQLGLSARGGGIAQPWVEPPDLPTHTATLRFKFGCDVPVTAPKLALEGPATIRLNGQSVTSQPEGYWVDAAIQTVALPDLTAGDQVLEVTLPFGRNTNLEWCYLLGDFGVEVAGRAARITAPVRSLAFGDWTRQGLPFYAGNVTYHCRLPGAGKLRVPRFAAPLLTVAVDGNRLGPIAFPPYELELPAGGQRLDITTFGSRINAFGQLHNCVPGYRWWGPQSWRTEGDEWSYEYQLRPQGVLVAPRVLAR